MLCDKVDEFFGHHNVGVGEQMVVARLVPHLVMTVEVTSPDEMRGHFVVGI